MGNCHQHPFFYPPAPLRASLPVLFASIALVKLILPYAAPRAAILKNDGVLKITTVVLQNVRPPYQSRKHHFRIIDGIVHRYRFVSFGQREQFAHTGICVGVDEASSSV